MTLPRSVVAEALDGLAKDDPAAMRSRRDLRRVHLAMGTRGILSRELQELIPLAGPTAGRVAAASNPASPTAVGQAIERRPLNVLELGAGDGSLMLGVAQMLAPSWPPVTLTLLDRQALVGRATIDGYAAFGWTAAVETADICDWVAVSKPRYAARCDLVVANLFLHHFDGASLAALLNAIAARADRFVACEPRRAWFPLAASHLIGALGANAVTRADAVLSVHAGFRGTELTALWPRDAGPWQLREYSAGLFSHCFAARRAEAV